MESRIAIIGIIVEDIDASSKVNDIRTIIFVSNHILWIQIDIHNTAVFIHKIVRRACLLTKLNI